MPKPHAWVYEPNHDHVAHLDDIFRGGNAPRLAGMLLSLANPSIVTPYPTPCYLNMPWILVGHDDGDYPSYKVSGSDALGADYYSILQGSARKDPKPDLTVDQFFYHADVLSGQDIGKVREHLGTKLDKLDLIDGGFAERAVTALDGTRTRNAASYWTMLYETFAEGKPLWSQWTGTASDEARTKFGNVRMWFEKEGGDGEFRQRGLLGMSVILIKYAAVIHGARMNLDNLMGELVEQVNHWNETGGATDDTAGKFVALNTIMNFAKDATIGKAFNAVEAIAAAGELVGDHKIIDEQVYDKLDNYLKKADEVVSNAVEEVNALSRELDHIRDGRDDVGVSIPVWPA